MSEFSNRSDLADTCEICGIQNIVDNYDVYAANNILPLKIEKPSDLIPYYPYITSSATFGEEGGTINLSARSSVDEEEERFLNTYLSHILLHWRRCKRKKEDFKPKEVARKVYLNNNPPAFVIELAERVAKDGDKATIDDIHIPSHDRYREMLYNEMVSHGWDEYKAYSWCYGWRRSLERLRKEQQEESDTKEKNPD